MLELAPDAVQVYFGHDDRVMLKQHPSGAILWLTVRGEEARMSRRIERGLADLVIRVDARSGDEVEREHRRAMARNATDRLVAESLPADVTAARSADGKLFFTSVSDPRAVVHTWADGDDRRAKVKGALARLRRRIGDTA